MFVPTKDLPDIVQEVLESVGFHKADIDVEPAVEAHLSSPYGTGYQTFAVGVDITRRRVSREVASSWGGPNMFEHRTLDQPSTLDLPEGTMLIMGQRGGGRPVSAKLYAHPGLMAPMLEGQQAADLSVQELAVLAIFKGIKGGYREEEARRYKLPFKTAVARLVELGFLKTNRAGATQITTDGRNLITSDARRALHEAGYHLL
jgi:hypothetical protein